MFKTQCDRIENVSPVTLHVVFYKVHLKGRKPILIPQSQSILTEPTDIDKAFNYLISIFLILFKILLS